MRVAVVEDKKETQELMRHYFHRYQQEHGEMHSLTIFDTAIRFLDQYRWDYDLVMMDIGLPMMDGMRAARLLREKDDTVLIVFITDLKQYAIDGYTVNALDFIVKPVRYFDFELLLQKVSKSMAIRSVRDVQISSAGCIRSIPSSLIRYVEVYHHKLTIHKVDENIEIWGALSDIEQQVPAESFSRCSSSFLVNLKYVDSIEKDEVIIGTERLRIAHLRRKDFVQDVLRYISRRR